MARRKRDDKTKDLFAYAEDNRASIVYMATNTVNGKRYIGITRQDFRKRQAQHYHDAWYYHEGNPRQACVIFYRAIRRYGRDAFAWETLAHCDSYKEAAREEIRLIALLKPEYNSSAGGDGVAGVGHRHSLSTRKKMSAAKQGRPGHWLGKKRSPATIEKMRARLLAKPIRRPWDGGTRVMTPALVAGNASRRKWVICLDDGKRYHGLKAAAAAYAIPHHREIAHVCKGKIKSIYGHRFRYEEAPG